MLRVIGNLQASLASNFLPAEQRNEESVYSGLLISLFMFTADADCAIAPRLG